MVIAFLEGQVKQEREGDLLKAFKEATKKLDEGIVQAFLIRNTQDPNVWRIFSLWKSKEAFEKMKQSVGVPRGVLIFRAAGVEPTLSLNEVIVQVSP